MSEQKPIDANQASRLCRRRNTKNNVARMSHPRLTRMRYTQASFESSARTHWFDGGYGASEGTGLLRSRSRWEEES